MMLITSGGPAISWRKDVDIKYSLDHEFDVTDPIIYGDMSHLSELQKKKHYENRLLMLNIPDENTQQIIWMFGFALFDIVAKHITYQNIYARDWC